MLVDIFVSWKFTTRMGLVQSNNNTITFEGDFGEPDLRIALAAFHNLTVKLGYKAVVLDFSKLQKVHAPEIVPFCTYVRSRLHNGVDATLELPATSKIARLFENTNWAYLMDPRQFPKSEAITHLHLPAVVYTSGDEQHFAVENTIQILLSSLEGLTRAQLAALEWAINEISDNVLNHAESPVGGVMQVTSRKFGQLVEFVVCDAGVGIPHTLRNTHSNISSDTEALDRAIREGVTRNKNTNMGNGLYGSYRISQLSGGSFKMYSGYARLSFDAKNGMHVQSESVPYNGTLIACTIDCSNSGILEEALEFRGKKYTPAYSYFDRIDDQDRHVIAVKEETKSFGSRVASRPIRNKIENILDSTNVLVEIDMSDVELISSSFADEIFGKIFLKLGPLVFMQRVKLTHMSKLVSQLADRAITQRMSGK